MKLYVVYDTKYGNTKLVAEKIVEGVKEVDGVETDISKLGDVDLQKLADSDVILIGAPVHFGGPSRAVRGFIDKLAKLDLKAKWASVFDTYLKADFERGVKSMEERIGEKLPRLKLIVPGLSIQVADMKGPIMEGEIPKCVDFGKSIAARLKA